MNFTPMEPNQPHHSNPAKYKTTLCKHFTSQKGCSFGDRCQFAHGADDLKSMNGMPFNPMNQHSNQSFNPHHHNNNNQMDQPKGPNPQNYKIVKCKYWEKDQTCRYGTLCTFAHGDTEIRTKSDNTMNYQPDQMNPINPMNPMNPMGMPMGMNPMFPGGISPYFMGFDPNLSMPMPGMMDYSQDPKAMNEFLMNMQQQMPMMGQMNQMGQMGQMGQMKPYNIPGMNKGQFDPKDGGDDL